MHSSALLHLFVCEDNKMLRFNLRWLTCSDGWILPRGTQMSVFQDGVRKVELHMRSRGERGGSLGAFDFPSSASKGLQTSPSQPWQAHLHIHLRIITRRQMGAAAAHLSVSNWHIYIFNHPNVFYMTHTHARCKLRHTDTQADSPLTVPRGLSRDMHQTFRSLTVAVPDWRLWSSCNETKNVDYGLFRSWKLLWTHATTELPSLASRVWVSFSSHRILISIRTCAILLFREFLFIWQNIKLDNKREMIIRLLFWYYEALTQFGFVPRGALLCYIALELNHES